MLHITGMLLPHLARPFLLCALILSFVGAAWAQSALDGFDPNANGAVNTVVIQPDGKILIGGDFTSLSPNNAVPVTRNRIARLNPNGSLDTAFNPNADGTVNAIAVQEDGAILVGGTFANVGGQPRNRIARLNALTGLADSFNPNANGEVIAIAVQTDGRILVGGDFSGASSIGSQTRNRIARLDPLTGMADPFDPNAQNTVRAILVQSDGKIIVGGAFNGANSIGGQLRQRIARLDPVTGAADPFNPGATGLVRCLAVQADGKVLAGGAFNGTGSIGGQLRNRIARLDPVTGAADAFDPNATTGNVYSIAVQPDGKILAGGTFTNIGGQPRSRIARLNFSSGSADSFDPNSSATGVFSLATQADGKILAGGAYSTLTPNGGAGLTRNNIARLEKDGRLDRTLDLGTVGFEVAVTAVQPDGKILIGGSFHEVLGVTRDNIARLNTDGTLDLTFNPNAGAKVLSIVVQADGKILVGGMFSSIGGQTRHNIARLDAATGSADTFNPNSDGTVYSIAMQSDGKVLAGGDFSNIGGQFRNRIARLEAVAGTADAFNPNGNGTIRTIAVQADGKILVAGTFTANSPIGGQNRFGIARLDAETGLADSFNPNPDDFASSILVQSDGKILVGGPFGSIGGQTRTGIARLDAATGLADSFNPNAQGGDVVSIAQQSDGKILVGGSFDNIGGQPRGRIARLDPITGSADSFLADAFGVVDAIAIQADGKILVGGQFTIIGGQSRDDFARLNNVIPAHQELSVTQTSVMWMRNGSSPQFARVTFEDSIDGVNYNFLGNGTAAGSNWTLTDLNLSTGQNLFIRARGTSCSGLYNSSGNIEESVRNAFLTNAPTITGTVIYGNAIGAPTPRFVSNVLLTGAGSTTVMTTTAAPGGTAGQYSLTGFGTGSYTVTPTKTTGQNSITSFDAAKIAQHVAGTSLLTGNQLIVADVSGNGTISSFDAGEIANYVVTSSPAGSTGVWRFSPVNRTYSSITTNVAGEDYTALLMGEVSGNWMNTGARAVGRRQLQLVEDGEADAGSGPERSLAITASRVVTPAGHIAIVPVSVEGTEDKNIISYEFDLRYDPSVIQPLPYPVDIAGTVSRGFSVATNMKEPGLLRVAVYGRAHLDGDGVLLNLRFIAVGVPGSVSSLTWERILFNEDPAAMSTDGQVEISGVAPAGF